MKTDNQHFPFTVIFFLSGAASLVYQVAWMRKLSLFFGSDVYSTAVTLSAFMAGLSIGSWISGRFGRRLKKPLLAYGAIEICLAVYALAFTIILALFDPWLSEIYRADYLTDPAIYQIARAAIAFVVLLPPTALMGATLPLVIQHFAASKRILGARLGYFYAINTLGALTGTLAAGFALLPIIGVSDSITTGAVVNVGIGIAGICVGRSAGPVQVDKSEPPPQFIRPRRNGAKLLAAMAMSGFAALALEVVWTRILVQSFSATAYAFSIMLASFLLGIYFGSLRESRVVDRRERRWALLMTLELGLFAYVAALSILTYLAPSFFGVLLWGLVVLTAGGFGVASFLAQFIAAICLIVPATTMLGATFPLAIKIYSQDIGERARDTGAIYAANTLGALLGALVAGFGMIPAFGVRGSLIVIAGIFLITALVLWPMREQPITPAEKFLSRAIGGIGLSSCWIALLLPQQIIMNFNMQRSSRPNVIFHGEGAAHTVDIIRTKADRTLMMIDGNIEADTTLLQRRHFVLKAHLPLLLNQDPRDVAVIGLGLGITLSATARNPEVKHIRLIELSSEMVRAQRYLAFLTDNVLTNPKVSVVIDDGRNFLNRSTESFNVITADPIHPRISGVGFLYTREYYESVKSRLRVGGYILQWMPMYSISRRSFDVAFRTFVSVFPHASFWYVRGHGLFVAGTDKFMIDYPTLRERFASPTVLQDFQSIGIASPEQLLSHLLMDEEQIVRYLRAESQLGTSINTDDNGYLEYATPNEFLDQTQPIIDALIPFAGWDRSRLVGASTAELALIDRLWNQRLSKLDGELGEPIE